MRPSFQMGSSPTLKNYIAYLSAAEGVDRSGVMEELPDLEEAVEQRLAIGVEEKKTAAARRELMVLGKVAHHQLTPSEWRAYETQRPDPVRLTQRMGDLSGRTVSSSGLRGLDAYEAYSRLALKRNRALADNLLAKMRREKEATGVLVAGGFHTEGLMEALKASGASYVVLGPKITKVPQNASALAAIVRDPLPIEKLLTGDIIRLATPRLTGSTDGLSSRAPVAAKWTEMGKRTIGNLLYGFHCVHLHSSGRGVDNGPFDSLRRAGYLSDLVTEEAVPLEAGRSRLTAVAVRGTGPEGGSGFALVESKEPGVSDGAEFFRAGLTAKPVLNEKMKVEGHPVEIRTYRLDDVAPPSVLVRWARRGVVFLSDARRALWRALRWGGERSLPTLRGFAAAWDNFLDSRWAKGLLISLRQHVVGPSRTMFAGFSPAQERHLAEAIRSENVDFIVNEIRRRIEDATALIDFFNECHRLMEQPEEIPAQDLDHRARALAHNIWVLDGRPENEPSHVQTARFNKARQSLLDRSRPLLEVGPIEGQHPVLKAITLLSAEEEETLWRVFKKATGDDPVLTQNPLVDSFLILRGQVDGWSRRAGIDYKRVYGLSAEGPQYWKGGLGPVITFHGDAMTRLGDNDVEYIHVNGDYQTRRVSSGELQPLLPEHYSTPLKFDESKTLDFWVTFHGDRVHVRAREGRTPSGGRLFLLRDVQSDGSSYYMKTLYDYGRSDNPVQWEESSFFLSLASLALIERLESGLHVQEGSAYRPPVIFGNDSQTAHALVLLSQIDDRDNPVTRPLRNDFPFLTVLNRLALTAFTTHTYFNRVWRDNRGDYRSRIQSNAGVSGSVMDEIYLRRDPTFHTDYLDYATGGLRSADWRGAVARKHAWDVMRMFDPDLKVVGVTNGTDLEWSAGKMVGILKTLFGKEVDLDRPEPRQILTAKVAAKGFFREALLEGGQGTISADKVQRFQGILEAWGRSSPAQDFTEMPTVGYIGRLVPEKFRRWGGETQGQQRTVRAWTDENIRALVQAGCNVILPALEQQDSAESNELRRQLDNLQRDLDDEWVPGHGRMIFLNNFSTPIKQAALAALDVLVLDSDEDTEANGYTEVAASAQGALILAPPFFNGEGLIRGQGLPMDFDVPGKGNTLIPDDIQPGSYRKILLAALAMRQRNPLHFAAHQATSIRLSRILDSNITGSVYLSQWNRAFQKPLSLSVAGWAHEPIEQSGPTVKLTTRVRIRNGVSVDDLSSRVLLSPVERWGEPWAAKKEEVSLTFQRVDYWDGFPTAIFEGTTDLLPGRYEFYAQARSEFQGEWVMQDGVSYGNNAKMVVTGPPSSEFWDLGDAVEMDRTNPLEGVLLGGAARSIALGRLNARVEIIRAEVARDLDRAKVARLSLRRQLGEWSLRDADGILSQDAVYKAGQSLGQWVRRYPEGEDEGGARASHLVWAALASLGEVLVKDSEAEWARWGSVLARGFNENIFEGQERVLAAIESGRRLEIEVSETMIKGTLTEEDKTRLEELTLFAAHAEKLKGGRLTWILPQGSSSLEAFWNRYAALAPLRQLSSRQLTKADYRGEDGLHSVKKLLLDSQRRTDVDSLDPADLFLINRSEWVLESDLPKDVARLLISLAGGLIYDATEKMGDEIKRLFFLRTNA
jgi:hypothetical protein